MRNQVLVVLGPTAVGKTALGIQLAQAFDGEIISGDSQQVYRGLDIGTAKATPEERAMAVHHLIDVRNLDENFSAHDFVTEANLLIADILSRGKVPIIVGGTGLYLQALIEGYHLGGQSGHDDMMALRQELEALLDEDLQVRLESAGIELAEFSRRRAIRALEISKFGSQLENQGSAYDFKLLGLTADRELLYDRINQRVELMMTAGLLAEAEGLYQKAPEAQASKGIGYKEFFPYFRGEISLDEAVELVKRNSRRYAKRQLTWFKNRMQVDFYDVFDRAYPAQNLMPAVKNFLESE
ncbi:tRNA (adenosine(37)-N6)-dimethylallyltransferase MiaA [Lactococcus termiticola]|uniref:tRNA dimethylallyltransferase n=1 Tax=Lactococcus termiticola TaxID=2169526 RepID=A0A2R5HFW8_9LACT|nr:tRNA (adenosine(37)-N6)-dimethylallyltransferase MiaA [Lactococcus termiticola]GBG96959.1 tRNA delta(2)-isopentenylpyrophosphate transferase [Lactococcus termiticola]